MRVNPIREIIRRAGLGVQGWRKRRAKLAPDWIRSPDKDARAAHTAHPAGDGKGRADRIDPFYPYRVEIVVGCPPSWEKGRPDGNEPPDPKSGDAVPMRPTRSTSQPDDPAAGHDEAGGGR